MPKILPKSEWHSYFQRQGDKLHDKQTRIEITGPGLGDQVLAVSVAMVGITYEPKTDLLQISVNGTDHLVRNPHEILVEESNGKLDSVQVVDREGMHQLISLHPANS